MTSYSVLRSGTRATVIATWPGEWSDQSATVTSVSDSDQATQLAAFLTRLSEDSWDAAGFLDSYPAIERAVGSLIEQLRSTADKVSPMTLDGSCYRHTDQWSYADLRDLFDEDVADALNPLTRAQRLSVADELAADAADRIDALKLLPTGHDPASETSRIWQMCLVTRSLRNGEVGPLPEGAAGWIVRGWGPETSPARRWGCRDRLVRIEQLVAACLAHGGRGRANDEPLQAHLVIPHAGLHEDDEVIYVNVHPHGGSAWDTDPFAPMNVTSYRGLPGHESDLGEIDASDSEGFARVLGEWTRLVSCRI